MATETQAAELRPGLPGNWNYQPPKGPIWRGVTEERSACYGTHYAGSLEAATRWISERASLLASEA